ncbi:hypothetical protein Taro_026240, partial [Colocasia esculenta]|nr:hypothetical protein [Colocasia esculenta]
YFRVGPAPPSSPPLRSCLRVHPKTPPFLLVILLTFPPRRHLLGGDGNSDSASIIGFRERLRSPLPVGVPPLLPVAAALSSIAVAACFPPRRPLAEPFCSGSSGRLHRASSFFLLSLLPDVE